MGLKSASLLCVVAVSSAAAKKARGDGLSGVINQLESMRTSVQVLHDNDADNYDKASCHCEEQTNFLSADSTGRIPQESDRIQREAATIELETALIEKSKVDLATNQEELATLEATEKEQVAAWKKREAQLNADIDEVTQAANALAAAQKFLSDHPTIVSLVQDMNKDVTTSLRGYNKALGEETASRDNQHSTYITNSDNEKAQIKQGKLDIEGAEGRKSKATGEMLAAEKEVKELSHDLNDLVKYCELQAKDWDKHAAKRQEDYHVLSVAINVLSCGSEDCGTSPTSFLQVQKSTSTQLRQSPAAQKAAIRSLVRLGAKTGNKDLMLLQSLLKRDPLIGAKKLIRKIVEKLTKEAALDQGEMNVCATELAECKTKRDFAMENVSKAKIALEELSASMEEDKSEFASKAEEWRVSTDNMNQLSQVDIPSLIQSYDTTKAELTEEKNRLTEAVLILRKHFGVEDNNLHEGPKDSSSGLKSSPDRKVNDAGETQSTGASVVNMLQQNLDERKADLSSLREDHIAELAGLRQQKADQAGVAAGASARYEYLEKEIEKETALFEEKLLEMQGKIDVAASHGRCVQKLEPCGVQMDRRAQREQEIKALKEAWTILGGSDDDKPAGW